MWRLFPGAQRAGGRVRVPEHKGTASSASSHLPAPPRIYLSLQQHAGRPCQPIVRAGERVVIGQVVAQPDGLGAPIHSPVCGKVSAITLWPHPSGQFVPTIIIDNDGGDTVLPLDRLGLEAAGSPEVMEPADIRRLAQDAGLVGLGGGLFPTSVKLTPPPGCQIDTVIINGCECEPYLTCDDRLMQEQTATLVWGARAIRRAVGATHLLFAVEENKPAAIAALRLAITGLANAEVKVLPSRYPQGSELCLVRVLTGREVPVSGIPAQVGTLVQNVGTTVALGQALQKGRPLTERLVTVAGDLVQKPGNYWIPLGTLIQDVLQAVGVDTSRLRHLLMGGPMMGQSLGRLDVPVIKGTGGILAFSSVTLPTLEPQPCVRCGMCVKVCPQGLIPFRLGRLAQAGQWQQAAQEGLWSCMECGSCVYVCPSARPTVQLVRMAKAALRQEQQRRQQAQPAPSPRTVAPATAASNTSAGAKVKQPVAAKVS
ncbi:MAG: electron transport complex subunit RsxC [Limnochordaceae bacterium]|nr:electron transport complex subunit RsxC [Limnochordaceae bacterium]